MAATRKIPAVKFLFMVLSPVNFQGASMTGGSAVVKEAMACAGWKVAGTGKTVGQG
jgi:hypothetical protein